MKTCPKCGERYKGFKCPQCHPAKKRPQGGKSLGKKVKLSAGRWLGEERSGLKTMTANLIDTALIRTDGGTQPRAEIDDVTVEEYAEAVTEGAEFPPVVVYYDGEAYWLADGFHRLLAHKRAMRRQIPADVRQGTRREAVLYACGANAAHGLRRSNEDKRRVVLLLLADAEWGMWSDREIAKRCAVDHDMVGRLRGASSLAVTASEKPAERTYQTKYGTPATMDTGKIAQANAERRQPAPVPTETPPARAYPENGRDVAAPGRDVACNVSTGTDGGGNEAARAQALTGEAQGPRTDYMEAQHEASMLKINTLMSVLEDAHEVVEKAVLYTVTGMRPARTKEVMRRIESQFPDGHFRVAPASAPQPSAPQPSGNGKKPGQAPPQRVAPLQRVIIAPQPGDPNGRKLAYFIAASAPMPQSFEELLKHTSRTLTAEVFNKMRSQYPDGQYSVTEIEYEPA